jgi:hypothetical protein
MSVPYFVPNTASNNIFHSQWQHKCISHLNVAVMPVMSCVPYRGHEVPYPTTEEMVQWVYSSPEIQHNQHGFLLNLNGTDQLWVNTILAHRTLGERSRNNVTLLTELTCLLEMGLYNPRDSQDSLPHVLSRAFRLAASLSVAQLQLFDGLVDHVTELQNDVTHNVKILNKESQDHLKATREAVSDLLSWIMLLY